MLASISSQSQESKKLDEYHAKEAKSNLKANV